MLQLRQVLFASTQLSVECPVLFHQFGFLSHYLVHILAVFTAHSLQLIVRFHVLLLQVFALLYGTLVLLVKVLKVVKLKGS